MAGEFPVDLRTWRKDGGQDKQPPSSQVGDPPRIPSGHQVPRCVSSGATVLREPVARDAPMGQPDLRLRTQDAASPRGGLQEDKKPEMYLPLRKRRYAMEGANGDTPGPLAGKVPKTESGQEGNGARSPHCNGYHPCYVSMPYPRVPVSYYPGLASPFLNPELPPLLQPLTGPSLLGILPSYSLMPPAETQLALNIATATQQDEDGDTPLHIAVAQGNLLAAQHLVILFHHGQRELDIFNNLRQDIKSGRSPLLHAVENNNLDMVELLLQHGANVNAQSYGGNTALHTASGRGLLDMLRLLVRNGADGSLKNYHNDTALMVAKNKRVIDILRGKAVRPIPHPENSHDGSSPSVSAASSPGLRTHSHMLHASPDSCSTIPSPDQTPKPHRASHSPNTATLRPESIIVTNGPSTSAPLPGVELDRSSHSSTLEQPMGFPRSSKLLHHENMTDPAFHTALYPFSPPSPHVSSHPLQLLPMSLNHPVISMPPRTLASRMSMRYPGMDQSQRLPDSEGPAGLGCEGQWLQSSDGGPGGS
ncbi:B-cell lymphoma 3 protein isoform X2 [Ahaetulla prasina]|uniref:B-cell lymphoma 3 protein isoform X2 n=1 Tax=Ahaetulla prasina TaxID=499056 RepID=UPI002649CA2E|nr:B-cell lymphoma 3 protein isoform X2 [Ahaetulla prasina]